MNLNDKLTLANASAVSSLLYLWLGAVEAWERYKHLRDRWRARKERERGSQHV